MWGRSSGHTYDFTRRPDGTTEIDSVVVRDGKNFKGQLLGLVLKTVGRGVLEKAFINSVKAIEARNGGVNTMKPDHKKEQQLSEEGLQQTAGSKIPRLEGELSANDLHKVSGGAKKGPVK